MTIFPIFGLFFALIWPTTSLNFIPFLSIIVGAVFFLLILFQFCRCDSTNTTGFNCWLWSLLGLWGYLSFSFSLLGIRVVLFLFGAHCRRWTVLDRAPMSLFISYFFITSSQLSDDSSIVWNFRVLFEGWTQFFGRWGLLKSFLGGYCSQSWLFHFGSWLLDKLLILSGYIHCLIWVENRLCYCLVMNLLWLESFHATLKYRLTLHRCISSLRSNFDNWTILVPFLLLHNNLFDDPLFCWTAAPTFIIIIYFTWLFL